MLAVPGMCFGHDIIAVVGHYGSGKTNVAVNLAMSFCDGESDIAIVDLDIVNPYFRTADSKAELEAAGIRCIVPDFVNTNVDLPLTPSGMAAVFTRHENKKRRCRTIIDVGGDNGAVALGVFERQISAIGCDMLCVINMYRPLTGTAAAVLESVAEIESCSRRKCTHLCNNSNLGAETTAAIVTASEKYAADCSDATGLPLVFTSALGSTADRLSRLRPKLAVFKMTSQTKELF